MSGILDYAKAIAELLAEFDAEVDLAPDYEMRNLKTARVVVLPAARGSKLASRIDKQNDFHLSVAVIKKVASLMEVEQLTVLSERIGNMLLGAKVLSGNCVTVEWEPIYSVDELREKRIFISVVKVGIKDFSR